MRTREYGQFCGLARAAEMLGGRWTLLILRDLAVGPRRYTDLASGLPGIPTNLLASRLKELESDGLVHRELRTGSERGVVYRLSARGNELVPVLDALGRWGAAEMTTPRPGEVVTSASLASALRAGATSGTSEDDRSADASGSTRRPDWVLQVSVGTAVAHAALFADGVTVGDGPHSAPDLVLVGGPRFRDVLAGVLTPAAARDDGDLEVEGDPDLLEEFARRFSVPYAAGA